MKQEALYQAKVRFDSAKDAAARMQNSQTYVAAENAWSDFLIAAGAIYAKLEQGAKGCSDSQSWFSRIKGDRKSDQLLYYIHHARNTEEHDINGSLLARANLEYVGSASDIGVSVGADREPKYIARPNSGTKIRVVEKFQSLKAVKDRSRNVIMPPTTHLGITLDDPKAAEVARLAITYLESLLADAAKLPQHA